MAHPSSSRLSGYAIKPLTQPTTLVAPVILSGYAIKPLTRPTFLVALVGRVRRSRNPTTPTLNLSTNPTITTHAPQPQQQSPRQPAHHIRRQIIQPRLPAGQKYLMPLIQHTDQQRSPRCQQNYTPAAQPAGQANRHRQHGKHQRVRKLIPRHRQQAHGNRLPAQPEQTEQNTHRQQHTNQPQVPR